MANLQNPLPEGEGCPRLQLHLPQTFPIAGSSALKLAIRYAPCPFPRAAYDPAGANLFRRIAAEPGERQQRIFLAQFRIQPEVTLQLAQDDGRAFEQARVSTGCASLLEFLSVSRERLEPARSNRQRVQPSMPHKTCWSVQQGSVWS